MYTLTIMQKDILEKITVEKQPGSVVHITGEIPFTELEKHRKSAVASIGKEIEIDGFRKGHIPESVLISKIGEMSLLTEMAERALSEVYPELVAFHALDIIGYPKISITKLAKDNPLGFSITVAIVPDITLPDYYEIAKGVNANKESKEISDEDVSKQIEDILRQKIAYERLQAKAGTSKEVPHVHDENCNHDHADHDHIEESSLDTDAKTEAIKLPELTDDYVKTLGKPGQFTSVDDFKSKIKEHMTVEKARDVDSRHRARITDGIIEKTTVELPQVMIDAEINQMFAQMEEDLKRAQLKMDDYLNHIKKTKEDLIKEWTPSAEKHAKLQLVLNEIAKKENITPDPSLVDHEVSHILEQYKDADEKRVRVYVSSILTNEAVLKKLEEKN